MAGWTYESIVRNGAIATVTFSRREGERDTALWHGIQATTVVGDRGFELGLGYGQYLALGYEFRALTGRPWTASSGLEPGQRYVGGEAAFMFLFFRASAGLVVPVGSGSHEPVLTGSFGFVQLFSSRPK
jgi:hypothetical protein